MKKIIILFGCVAVFMVGVSFFHITLKNQKDWMDEKIKQIGGAVETGGQAMDLYQELDGNWNDKVIFFGMLLPHDNLLEVSGEMTKLGVALENQDKEDADQAMAAISLGMQHLLERNTLRWDHVF